jgi:hypothetical protein
VELWIKSHNADNYDNKGLIALFFQKEAFISGTYRKAYM